MPITIEHDENQCARYIIITADSMTGEDGITTILSDFDTALTDLEAHLPDSDIYCHQICLKIKDTAPENGAFVGASMGDEKYDPWTSFCPSFWDKAISVPKFHESIEALLHRLRSILEEANRTSINCFIENEETQLGQPLVTHLAMRDRRFVPHFKYFLQHWDMDHEVDIIAAILEILETHGTCNETDDLLEYCLLERTDFDVRDDLLLIFKKFNPQASQSVLFRRFVVLNYRNHLCAAVDGCRVYQSKLKSGASDAEEALRYLAYRPMFDDNSKMAVAEAKIIGQLQDIQFPQSVSPTEKT